MSVLSFRAEGGVLPNLLPCGTLSFMFDASLPRTPSCNLKKHASRRGGGRRLRAFLIELGLPLMHTPV